MKPWLRRFYGTAARLAESLVATVPRAANSKLARTFSARKGLLDHYRAWGRGHRDRSRPLLWLHAASVGEALMALPVAERVRGVMPEVQMAFTFFSPSAEHVARGSVFDFVDYIPFDSRHSVSVALDMLAPSALVFTKSDVWPELVAESARRGVRLGLISASMPEQSRRATGLTSMLTLDAYRALNLIGAASEGDARALIMAGANPDRVRVTGDTRYDQAWTRAHVAPQNQQAVRALESDRLTIVAGSTWPADESKLLSAFARLRDLLPTVRLIIAPHEVDANHVAGLERAAKALPRSRVNMDSRFRGNDVSGGGKDVSLDGSGGAVPAIPVAATTSSFPRKRESILGMRVSHIDDADASDADVIIVDRIGILADLYALATIAYVGGGFHAAGLHSLVEPAVFRVPTVIGPRHAASRDARLLIAAGGVVSAGNGDTLFTVMHRMLTDSDQRTSMSDAMGFVVTSELGAADRSFEMVRELLRSV